MYKKLVRIAAIVVTLIVVFAAGWYGALRVHAGEQAMGNLIDLVSAMSFLEKGDHANALRVLQLSAEGNLLKVAKYGTPIMDWYRLDASGQWIQRYARIRESHPKIDYPGDAQLQKEIDRILAKHQATAK
jgi:hypothetical protein